MVTSASNHVGCESDVVIMGNAKEGTAVVLAEGSGFKKVDMSALCSGGWALLSIVARVK